MSCARPRHRPWVQRSSPGLQGLVEEKGARPLGWAPFGRPKSDDGSGGRRCDGGRRAVIDDLPDDPASEYWPPKAAVGRSAAVIAHDEIVSGGIVIVWFMLQATKWRQDWISSAKATEPLTTGRPWRMLNRFPGVATMRFRKSCELSFGVGTRQGFLGWDGTPHCSVSMPRGGWKTTASPIAGAALSYASRSTVTTSPAENAGSIDSLGIV